MEKKVPRRYLQEICDLVWEDWNEARLSGMEHPASAEDVEKLARRALAAHERAADKLRRWLAQDR